MSVLIIGNFRATPPQQFIGTAGAAPQPPELTVAEAVSSADQF